MISSLLAEDAQQSAIHAHGFILFKLGEGPDPSLV